ncbi:MAG: DUF2975 domain-containing protein [Chitinophagaceae bacterium]|nr:DUF2975 domain-containing protein [Chitinophagaceae bacterium]
MEIKIGTQQILTVLYVIAWIIFIGLCIEAGTHIFNALFTLLINPQAASYLNLKALYQYDKGYFITELSLISISSVLKALMFYLIVKILHDKKLNMAQPFNKELGRFIFNLSYLSMGIGLFCYWGVGNTAWLVGKGVQMPDIQRLRLGGADVWLFMGVTLLVIAQIFKRGIEIQSENELTV